MASPGTEPLPVIYATASGEAVGALVATEYGLDPDPVPRLLSRGFNDVYEVRTRAGRSYVLRLSGNRRRGPADVATETAFLAHLAGCGVAVARPVPTRGGALFTVARLPDRSRPAVLFEHVAGRAPDPDDRQDALRQGTALATVHGAAASFAGRGRGRYRLDLDHLLHRQVDAVMALPMDADKARADLAALAMRLAQGIEAVDADLARVQCHGDCHGMNARIPVDGPLAGYPVLFDFDDCGFGYLAYDLAVHLWAQVSFGRRRHAVWHAFRRGYESVRPLSAADQAAIPAFVAIRHIWLMGEYAGKTAEWGCEAVSAAWLRREVDFLLEWERAQLSPSLL